MSAVPDVVTAQEPVHTNHRWDFLNTGSKPPETAIARYSMSQIVQESHNPLVGLDEKTILSSEKKGDWQGQLIIDNEKERLIKDLKSPDAAVRDSATLDALNLRSAVVKGGETLDKYIESKSHQVEGTYEEARQKAENKPKEDEGQTAAVNLISDEAESLKTEISGEFTPDKSGKLKKLAGFAAMLEGVAGNSARGLKQLHIWLEAKVVEIEESMKNKTRELGLDADLSLIDSQLSAPARQPDQQIQIGAGEKQVAITAPEALQIQMAVKAGDENLLPQETAASAGLLLRTRELLLFNRRQAEKRKQVDLASSWTSSHQTAG